MKITKQQLKKLIQEELGLEEARAPSVFVVTAVDDYGPLEKGPLGIFNSYREAKAAVNQFYTSMGDEPVSDRGGSFTDFNITKHTLGRLSPATKTWNISVFDDLERDV